MCSICRYPADDSHVSVTLSRKLEGLECELNLTELPHCDISDVYRYTVHADCLPMLQHKVGGHESTPCPTCETCQLDEIRRLSPNARNLIRHRLRNPLCILTMAASSILLLDDGAISLKAGTQILEAAKRIDRELNALFVVH